MIRDLNNRKLLPNVFKQNYPQEYVKINDWSEKNDFQNFKFSRKYWHYINDVKKVPLCLTCNVNFLKWNSFSKGGYNKHCSISCAMSSVEVREVCKKNNVKKYGVENVFQSKVVKEKINETVKQKYGVNHITQSKKFKELVKNTNLKKYNVTCTLQANNILEKIKKDSMLKNGTFFPQASKNAKEKRLKTNLEKGNFIHSKDKNDFDLYRKIVSKFTNMNRKVLFKNWNGYDFYDNDFIFENLKLHYNDSNYPTIDHKISVYYGFINNIIPYEISKLENLCITKRKINLKKGKNITNHDNSSLNPLTI